MIITIDTEHPPTPVELKHLWNLLTDVELGSIPFEEDPRMTGLAEPELVSVVEVRPKAKRGEKVLKVEATPQQMAIAVATRLVSEDKTEVVRAALEAIDEERVSKLTEDKAIAFLEALES